MIAVETRSAKETQKAARLLARELRPSGKGAVIAALVGELGAGKTTFVQGFARALGVEENVLSPTFVLMKVYAISSKLQALHPPPKFLVGGKSSKFKHLVHIDCYRIDSPEDLLHLGFDGLLKDKDAIILIEWADRVKKIIPPGAVWIRFGHGRRPNKRVIEFL